MPGVLDLGGSLDYLGTVSRACDDLGFVQGTDP